MNPYSIASITELVRAETDPASPLVRAALDHAVGVAIDVGASTATLTWGMFATAVQAVTAAHYPVPAPLRILADQDVAPPSAENLASLVLAAADVFATAATDSRDPRAWQNAAAVTQLREAVAALRLATR